MSLDSLCLLAVADELDALSGSRIVDIQQIDSNDIALVLRDSQSRVALVISVLPGFARLFRMPPPRAGSASSALLNTLRDHLLSGTLERVEAVPGERIATVRCSVRGPLGARAFRLIVECIDRHTTLVFVAEPDGVILETLRRIRSGGRTLIPGERYELPEPSRKIPLDRFEQTPLHEIVDIDTPERMAGTLVKTFAALSPAMAGELVARAGFSDPERIGRLTIEDRERRLRAAFSETLEWIREKRWTPSVGRSPDGVPAFLSALPVRSLPPERVETFSTMSAAIIRYYDARLEEERIRDRQRAARQMLGEEIRRLERLMENLWKDAEWTDREQEFRKWGELLSAHLGKLQKGQSLAEIPDYYHPGQPLIPIELDPKLSPAENADRYFRQARKARDGKQVIEERMVKTEERLSRVRAALNRLGETPSVAGIDRAHEDCLRLGLIREPRPAVRSAVSKKIKKTDIHPRRFVTTDGYMVLVGRNNQENEALTKSAAPDDIWLHARDMGGSHVILRREGKKDMPSRQALFEASRVAAHFSKGRHSSTVPVDYTERRYVRKQKNGGPGQVIFTHEKTLFVEPGLVLKEADETINAG